MNEWTCRWHTWNFTHTKTKRVHSARCTLAYITQLYIKSIQPANKAAKHLINSYDYICRTKATSAVSIPELTRDDVSVGFRVLTLVSSCSSFFKLLLVLILACSHSSLFSLLLNFILPCSHSYLFSFTLTCFHSSFFSFLPVLTFPRSHSPFVLTH